MIECIICNKYKTEGAFPLVRGGGLSICSDCLQSEESIKLQEQSSKNIEEEFQRRQEYEQKKRDRIANQDYDGQYDWM